MNKLKREEGIVALTQGSFFLHPLYSIGINQYMPVRPPVNMYKSPEERQKLTYPFTNQHWFRRIITPKLARNPSLEFGMLKKPHPGLRRAEIKVRGELRVKILRLEPLDVLSRLRF